MDSLIQRNLGKLKELCLRYDVRTMHIFGSALTEKFKESSDIDILIAFKDLPTDRYTDNFFDLHDQLEALFGRKVDLITENSLSNPYFIESIEETKQLLYAA
ncbi:MAG: nucleotidyltransferase domain-containing protein [Cyclobacteriaceae bacterium]